MLNEIKAIELSDNELDVVSGGAITIGDVQGYAQTAVNDFFQKNMTVAQQTFAGPNGSGTGSVVNLGITGGFSGQNIVVG
ncbi:MAG: CTB family bacteriocin [Leptolyngbya sp. Prado105]|jgi:hypothetical protein|nr:CTB family bacteriocin [Leptolyngbya sp. Prado105]